jgi:hypothetical protein
MVRIMIYILPLSDAVVNVRFAASQVMRGAAELAAYGCETKRCDRIEIPKNTIYKIAVLAIMNLHG